MRLRQCPECGSTSISKNGKQRGKQNYLCKACGRQFIETYDPPSPYSDDFKRECLKMYVNGMGFRGIERVKGVHHTTVMTWVKQRGELLPDTYDSDVPPEGGNWMNWRPLLAPKKQNLALDCCRPLPKRDLRVGSRRP